MGKKSGPKAPDPMKVSAAQTQSNKDTALFNAQLNRVNQSNPFGSINWSHTGDDPASGWSQTTTLSPQLQALLDSQTASQQGISDAISGAIGRLPTAAFDPSGIDVGDIRDRSLNSQLAALEPEFQKGWTNLETTMSDRGIPIGSEIWNNQQGEYNRARDSSLLAASRQADLDASNDYQRQYSNLWSEYNAPYTALGALMGNSSPVSNPSFSPFATSSSANTDVAGNYWNKYTADQQNYQNQQGQLWNGIAGIGQLGLALLSDERTKENIAPVGELHDGQTVYSYNYLGDPTPQIGLMAQEVEETHPEAVVTGSDGFKRVDYGRATSLARALAA